MSVYVVDSNFFIQAHRANYPLDVATSFWNKVKQLAEEGKIISIDKVKKEIYDHEDDLKQWCEDNLPEDFFKDTVMEIKRLREHDSFIAEDILRNFVEKYTCSRLFGSTGAEASRQRGSRAVSCLNWLTTHN